MRIEKDTIHYSFAPLAKDDASPNGQSNISYDHLNICLSISTRLLDNPHFLFSLLFWTSIKVGKIASAVYNNEHEASVSNHPMVRPPIRPFSGISICEHSVRSIHGFQWLVRP